MATIIKFIIKSPLRTICVIASLIFIICYTISCRKEVSKQPVYRFDKYFNLAAKPIISPIQINFQNDGTQAPVGWLKDWGEPFSAHPGVFEGSDLTFGWKSVADDKPLDLRGNGRARLEPEDVLLSTFMHMQADHISGLRYGAFDGVKASGYWELKVLNGVYKVTVATGDGAVHKAKELDCINVEGVKAIYNFKPMGKLRSPGRFKEATVTVTVNDGLLTIDAKGGINTKICYVSIAPISVNPYLYLESADQNLLLRRDVKTPQYMTLRIRNSALKKVPYKLTVAYPDKGVNWIHLSREAYDTDSVKIDYAVNRNLAPGTYNATISATADGYSSAAIDVRLRVVDETRPYVISANPINGATIIINSTIAANSISVPAKKGFKGGVNNATITNKTVKLIKVANDTDSIVPGNVQGTGGGDAISFTPAQPLEPYTNYKFVITSGVKSYSGASFQPFESSFSTSSAPVDSSNIIKAAFTKISVPGTQNKKYTSLTFGPDGLFYALKINGGIERFKIDHESGMLSGMTSINTLVKKRGESTAIGLTFDPSSTAAHPVAWVSYSSSGLNAAPEFDGKISRLSGPDLLTEEQMIINLPRSTRDHMVNSIVFGPDGALYISQGSNSSAGRFDKGWQREETLLAGCIMRLDLKKLEKVALPLDVKTTSNQKLIDNAPIGSIKLSDGTYNPYGINSPLTIFASGIRNGYDMVWHSNGQLYIPANGSGGGGNSPQSIRGTRRPDGTFYNGSAVKATENVPVQHDWLFRINPDRKVGYFGHPNPLRGEYVINRGSKDNPMYAPGVKPDNNYRGAAFDFGFNKSPNGVIEYKSNAFKRALKGKLLVCRFSGGGDIIVLEPGSITKKQLVNQANDSIYDIVKSASGSGNYGLKGMVGFANPLEITEDVTNGNLYISEFNWNENPNLISQITLLKVTEDNEKAVTSRSQIVKKVK
ncbi:hypothetical protein FPZ43_11345 [Mucilaginibacter pallidiroseus]|uniref:SbsA Ig-like domain-containing protein n=1 Tax=Mucilaginibacter pallidiroseus TaxID=2599295 RepID=A0A563UBV3_9SPHI|nr:Ig-like domain-containing protein [Mucilaginibacter pallidiroseus]TWR28858.1 hypothetical protein FPZ43_11345 [Mucilaginibacter pallidiroseus]